MSGIQEAFGGSDAFDILTQPDDMMMSDVQDVGDEAVTDKRQEL